MSLENIFDDSKGASRLPESKGVGIDPVKLEDVDFDPKEADPVEPTGSAMAYASPVNPNPSGIDFRYIKNPYAKKNFKSEIDYANKADQFNTRIDSAQTQLKAREERAKQVADAKAQKQQEADFKKGQNSEKEGQFRKAGQKYYTDAFGDVQAQVNEENKPMFDATPWKIQKGLDGRNVKTRRNELGEVETEDPDKDALIAESKIKPNQLFRKNKLSEDQFVGTVDEGLTSGDETIRGVAEQAREKQNDNLLKETKNSFVRQELKVKADLDDHKLQMAQLAKASQENDMLPDSPEKLAKKAEIDKAIEDGAKKAQTFSESMLEAKAQREDFEASQSLSAWSNAERARLDFLRSDRGAEYLKRKGIDNPEKDQVLTDIRNKLNEQGRKTLEQSQKKTEDRTQLVGNMMIDGGTQPESSQKSPALPMQDTATLREADDKYEKRVNDAKTLANEVATKENEKVRALYSNLNASADAVTSIDNQLKGLQDRMTELKAMTGGKVTPEVAGRINALAQQAENLNQQRQGHVSRYEESKGVFDKEVGTFDEKGGFKSIGTRMGAMFDAQRNLENEAKTADQERRSSYESLQAKVEQQEKVKQDTFKTVVMPKIDNAVRAMDDKAFEASLKEANDLGMDKEVSESLRMYYQQAKKKYNGSDADFWDMDVFNLMLRSSPAMGMRMIGAMADIVAGENDPRTQFIFGETYEQRQARLSSFEGVGAETLSPDVKAGSVSMGMGDGAREVSFGELLKEAQKAKTGKYDKNAVPDPFNQVMIGGKTYDIGTTNYFVNSLRMASEYLRKEAKNVEEALPVSEQFLSTDVGQFAKGLSELPAQIGPALIPFVGPYLMGGAVSAGMYDEYMQDAEQTAIKNGSEFDRLSAHQGALNYIAKGAPAEIVSNLVQIKLFKLVKPLFNKITTKELAEALGGTAISGLIGGGTEGYQQYMLNRTKKYFDKMPNVELTDDVWQSFKIGGAVEMFIPAMVALTQTAQSQNKRSTDIRKLMADFGKAKEESLNSLPIGQRVTNPDLAEYTPKEISKQETRLNSIDTRIASIELELPKAKGDKRRDLLNEGAQLYAQRAQIIPTVTVGAEMQNQIQEELSRFPAQTVTDEKGKVVSEAKLGPVRALAKYASGAELSFDEMAEELPDGSPVFGKDKNGAVVVSQRAIDQYRNTASTISALAQGRSVVNARSMLEQKQDKEKAKTAPVVAKDTKEEAGNLFRVRVTDTATMQDREVDVRSESPERARLTIAGSPKDYGFDGGIRVGEAIPVGAGENKQGANVVKETTMPQNAFRMPITGKEKTSLVRSILDAPPERRKALQKISESVGGLVENYKSMFDSVDFTAQDNISGGVQIRFSPDGKTRKLAISLTGLQRELQGAENPDQVLLGKFVEEVTHSVGVQVVSREESQNISKTMSPKLRRAFVDSYYASEKSAGKQGKISSDSAFSGELTDLEHYEIGQEFIRAIVQKDERVLGFMTEEAQTNPEFLPYFINALKKILDAITSGAYKMDAPLANEAKERIISTMDKLGALNKISADRAKIGYGNSAKTTDTATVQGVPATGLPTSVPQNRSGVGTGSASQTNEGGTTGASGLAGSPAISTQGRSYNVATPKNTMSVPVQGQLVELGDLKSSAGTNLQPRDRTRAGNREQELKIARNPNHAMWARPASTSDTGLTIVGKDGRIYSGHGRTNAKNLVYQMAETPSADQALGQKNAQGLRDEIKNTMRQMGEPESEIAKVDTMKRPDYVGMYQGDENPSKIRQFVRDSNIEGMSVAEQASYDALEFIDNPKLISNLRAGSNGEILLKRNDKVLSDFYNAIGSPRELRNKNGTWSKAMENRVMGALMALNFGQNSDTLITTLTEDAENLGLIGLRAGLVQAGPDLAVLGDGELDIKPTLTMAVEEFVKYKENGGKMEDFLSQGRLQGIESEASPETEFMMRTIAENPTGRAIGDFLRTYSVSAEAMKRERQAYGGGMFPETELPLTVMDVLKMATSIVSKGDSTQTLSSPARNTAETLAGKLSAFLDLSKNPQKQKIAQYVANYHKNGLYGLINKMLEPVPSGASLPPQAYQFEERLEKILSVGDPAIDITLPDGNKVNLNGVGASKVLASFLEGVSKQQDNFRDLIGKVTAGRDWIALVASPKKMKRLAEKIIFEKKGVVADDAKDILRATISVNTLDEMEEAIAEIQKYARVTQDKKNLYLDAENTGYAHRLILIEWDGLNWEAEVQINLPEMLLAKDIGHRFYEKIRSLEALATTIRNSEEVLAIERQIEELQGKVDQVWRGARDLITKRLNASNDLTRGASNVETSGNRVSGTSSQRQALTPSTATGVSSTSNSLVLGSEINSSRSGTLEGSSGVVGMTTINSQKYAVPQPESIVYANVEDSRGTVDSSRLANVPENEATLGTIFNTKASGSFVVKLDKLISPVNELNDEGFVAGKKADPRQTAINRMVSNLNGETFTPREPIDLADNGDGTYTIIDGNATSQGLMLAGWQNAVGVVKEFALSAPRRNTQDANQLSLFDETGSASVLSNSKQGGIESGEQYGQPRTRQSTEEPARTQDGLRGSDELFSEYANRSTQPTSQESGTPREVYPREVSGDGMDSVGQRGGVEPTGGTRSGDGVQSGTQDTNLIEGESGIVGSNQDSARENLPVRVKPTVERPAEGTPERNHEITPEDILAPKGDVTRLKTNISVIQLLKKLESEDRNATTEEKKILAQYVGWGGLSQALDEDKADRASRIDEMRRYGYYDEEEIKSVENWNKKYGKYYNEVKDLLSEDEFRSAKASTTNAHYTSPKVINYMWDAVRKLGFNGGTVLEPAGGIGHFFGLMPKDMADSSYTKAVELDSLSGRIMRKLYPETDVQITGFEDADIPDNSIDLAISNVPFANVQMYDSGLEAQGAPKLSLHNYFFAKALEKVRPSGVVAFITTSNTLDANVVQRKWIADHGELIGAVRLPNTAFSENANTEVTTDIIFIRKPDGKMPSFNPESFKSTKEVSLDNGGTVKINEYFDRNPDMILGRLANDGSMYGGKEEMTVRPFQDGRTLESLLSKSLEKLSGDVMGQSKPVDREAITNEEAMRGKKVGTLAMLEDGKLGIAGVENSDEEILSPKNRPIATGFIQVRDALNELYRMEMDPESQDAEIEDQRKALNVAYDNFVARNGSFHANSKLLDFDPDYYRIIGAENEVKSDSKAENVKKFLTRKKNYTKGDIFTKRILTPRQEPTSASSVEDAMGISLGWKGTLDTDYIAGLVGKSKDEVENDILSKGIGFRDPATGLVSTKEEYLSGNVRKKLKIAEEKAKKDNSYEANIEALKKVQPVDVPFSDISMNLGANWIPTDIISDFGRSILKTRVTATYSKGVGDVSSDRYTVTYGSDGKGARSMADLPSEATSIYGTDRMSGVRLLEMALNMQTPMVFDTIDEKKVLNAGETEKAKLAMEKIKESFAQYASSKPEVSEELAKQYNEKRNSHALRQYDGQFLTFPWLAKGYDLYPDKKNVVWRAIQDGKMLIAHGVGGGKTVIGTALTMELRRLGLAKKPMIVVHNATLEQFAGTIGRMAPTSRVLVARKKDFEKSKRKEFVAKIASGDWDAVVMAHSTFNQIKDDPEYVKKITYELIDELRDAIAQTMSESNEVSRYGRISKKKDPSVKEKEKQIKRLEERLKRVQERKVDDVLTFQELGVDAIILDEAHIYKKMPFVTKLKNIAGIDNSPTESGTSLLTKARFIQEKNKGRNMFTMTGTPVTNTLGEVWNQVRLIDPELLAEFGSSSFDSFVSTFAEVERSAELRANGKYKSIQRLSKLANLPEWNKMFRTRADVKMGGDMVVKNRPEIKDGKPDLIAVEATPQVIEYKKIIDRIIDDFDSMDGREKKENSHIPLVTYNACKLASIDMRLVDDKAKDEAGSKSNTMIEKVFELYKRTNDYNGTQVIFSDRYRPMKTESLSFNGLDSGVETDDSEDSGMDLISGAKEEEKEEREAESMGGFNLYTDIKEKLIKKGVKPEEIAVINDFKTDQAKEQLFEKVNNGTVRIIIGSTQKLGTGVNMQGRMIAGHNLDVPWTPAEMEQRDGRVIRQGNIHSELGIPVEIYRYGMKDTLDSALWQKLEFKERFIKQALSGKISGRVIEDDSGLLSLAEQKAILSGPMGLEKFNTETKIRELENQERAWVQSSFDAIQAGKNAELQVKAYENRLNQTREFLSEVSNWTPEPTAMIEGVALTKENDIRDAIQEYFDKRRDQAIQTGKSFPASVEAKKPIGEFTYNGTKITLSPVSVSEILGEPDPKKAIKVETGVMVNGRELGSKVKSAGYVFSALRDLVKNLKSYEQQFINGMGSAQETADSATIASSKAFPRKEELDGLRAKYAKIMEDYTDKGKAKRVEAEQMQLNAPALTPSKASLLSKDAMNLIEPIARSFVSPQTSLDEAIQIGRIALIKAVQGFDPNAGDFDKYAKAVVRNALKKNYSRNEATAREISMRSMNIDSPVSGESTAPLGSIIPDENQSLPSQSAITNDAQRLMQTMIDGLPVRPRTVVSAYMNGEGVSQIAEKMGISRQYALTMLNNALSVLRKRLAKVGIEETKDLISGSTREIISRLNSPLRAITREEEQAQAEYLTELARSRGLTLDQFATERIDEFLDSAKAWRQAHPIQEDDMQMLGSSARQSKSKFRLPNNKRYEAEQFELGFMKSMMEVAEKDQTGKGDISEEGKKSIIEALADYLASKTSLDNVAKGQIQTDKSLDKYPDLKWSFEKFGKMAQNNSIMEDIRIENNQKVKEAYKVLEQNENNRVIAFENDEGEKLLVSKAIINPEDKVGVNDFNYKQVPLTDFRNTAYRITRYTSSYGILGAIVSPTTVITPDGQSITPTSHSVFPNKTQAIMSAMGVRNPQREIHEGFKPMESLFSPTRNPDMDAVEEYMDYLGKELPETNELINKADNERNRFKITGNPTLANPAKGMGRNLVNAVDEARKDILQRRPDVIVMAEARALLANDEEGVKRMLLERAVDPSQAGLPTDVEVRSAKLLVEKLARRAMTSGDEKAQREASILAYAYRQTGSEVARSLRARIDDYKTPAERHKAFLTDLIFNPTKEIERKIKYAISPAEKSRRIQQLEAQLLNESNPTTEEELKRVRKEPDSNDILQSETAKRLAKIETALGKWGVTLADLFSGEVQVSLKTSSMIDNTLKGLNPREVKAIRMIQQRNDVSKIKRITGLKAEEIEALRQSVAEEIRQKLMPKTRRGATVEDLATEELGASASYGNQNVSEADALRQADRILSAMGLDDAYTKPNMFKRRRAKVAPAGPNFPRPELTEDGYTFDITDAIQVKRVARAIQTVESSMDDILVEMWVNSILSGAKTFIANLSSGPFSVYEMTVGRGIQSMVNLAFNDPKSASFGEFKPLVAGISPAISRAWSNAVATWYTESGFFEEDILDQPIKLLGELDRQGGVTTRGVSISGAKGRFIRIPSRLLLATDDFVKTMTAQMEVGAQAYRMGKANGLTGQDMERFIREQVNTAGSDAWIKASEKAYAYTFQTELPTIGESKNVMDVVGASARALNKFVKARPESEVGRMLLRPFQLIFPFIRTPFNLLKEGVKRSPLGLPDALISIGRGIRFDKDGISLSSDMKPEVIENISNQLVSSMVTAVIWGMVEGDDDDDDKYIVISGSKPSKLTGQGERDLANRTLPAMTIRVGSKQFSYARIDPLATALGTTVDMIRAIKKGQQGLPPAEVLAMFQSYLMQAVESKTYMRGMDDLGNLLNGQNNVGTWTAGQLGTVLVPNLIRQPLREMDPYVRDTKTGKDTLKGMAYSVLPVPMLAPPPLRTPEGVEIKKRGNALIRAISPITFEDAPEPSKLDQFMMKYNRNNPSDPFYVSRPTASYKTLTGNDKKMTPEQYSRFTKSAGEKAKMAVAPLLAMGQTPEAKDKISSAIQKARTDARKEQFGIPLKDLLKE
jgi:RNA polymerase sigma factor (sigma-70 family)